MHRFSLLVLTFLLLNLVVPYKGFCQMDCQVLWSKHSLDWSHFQPSDSVSGNQKAFSSIGITYTAEMKNDNPSVSFDPYFIQEDSWVLEGANTKILLVHEQRLFDIAEVYARKMRETLSLYLAQNDGTQSMREILVHVRSTYMDLTNELLEKIRLYNVETNYGKNVRMQQKWNNAIDADLKKLDTFATTD